MKLKTPNVQTFEYDFQFEGGKDYLVELSTGESNLLKNDLKRFVFTTAEPSNICPAGLLTGYNPKKMHLLRHFIDNFLNKSKTGRQSIRWYYDHANELQSILINNPSIRLMASRMIDKVLPTMSGISPEKYLFNEQMLMVDFMELCSAAIAKASPEMGTVIKKIQQIHKEGNLGSAVTR